MNLKILDSKLHILLIKLLKFMARFQRVMIYTNLSSQPRSNLLRMYESSEYTNYFEFIIWILVFVCDLPAPRSSGEVG